MQKTIDIPKILRFWIAIEASLHQKADKENEKSEKDPAYAIDASKPLMPWENKAHLKKKIPDNKVWQYTLQCGLYETKKLAKEIEKKLGSHEDVFDDRISHEKSRLFDLNFDENGYPIANSFMLSLAGWSTGQLLNYGVDGLENGEQVDLKEEKVDLKKLPTPGDEILDSHSGYGEFDALVRAFRQELTDQTKILKESETPATFSWLQDFTQIVSQHCLLPEQIVEDAYLGKCYQIRHKEESEQEASASTQGDSLLNSFFIQDLNRLLDAWKINDVGDGFVRYMTAVAQEKSGQIDVRTPDGREQACQQLHPSYMPAGKWPSNFPLAFSQQLAVNTLWKELNTDSQGIFAVNGPPGTGKTTLLRDVVAAVVTQRAQTLIELGKRAFTDAKLHSALSGTAIVVASANNGAVENISLELPGIAAIPESMLDTVDYYRKLATQILSTKDEKKQAWGLLAARLGRKKYRTGFMGDFWWSQPQKKQPDSEEKQPIGPAFEDPEEGLRYHLQLIQKKRRKPALDWKDAVEQFKKAQQAEAALRAELEGYAQLPKIIDDLKNEISNIGAEISRLQEKLSDQDHSHDDAEDKIQTLSSQLKAAQATEQAALHALQFHITNKPGLLMWISTLGTSHRNWWFKRQDLEEDHTLQRQKLRQLQRVLEEIRANQSNVASVAKQLRKEIELKEADQKEKQENLALSLETLTAKQKELGHNWPDPQADNAVRELSAPWSTPQWHQAREQLFLAALAVHRAFIEAHPSRIIDQMWTVSRWLNGNEIGEVEARNALNSLCLVVPVISTTFASLPRMLQKVGREAIGWLLIDEAGQALPQQAAGAIWRAKRTIVVGDPNQIEPVLPVPPCLEGALAKHYDVPQAWWPSKTSAQSLADQTMQMGTELPGVGGSNIWVGCPLRVHRRCDEPMFSISNEIAYDGLMVHGKEPDPSISYPKSNWIHVCGTESKEHWIAEEGQAAEELIQQLVDQGLTPDDLFLISPFRSCANELMLMAQHLKLKLDSRKTGTVHTTQGKEAEVVILVLGGNPQKKEAKTWATEKPNLFNVAVSRAKSRLYVIGNQDTWGFSPTLQF